MAREAKTIPACEPLAAETTIAAGSRPRSSTCRFNSNSERRRSRVAQAGQTLLRWLVFDRDGQPMATVVGYRCAKRYHYYAAPPLVRGDAADDAIRRVRGAALDQLVTDLIGRLVGDPDAADGKWLCQRWLIHRDAPPARTREQRRRRFICSVHR